MSELIVLIEDWGITTNPDYPASEPCLRGVVTGHPNLLDGDRIPSTSPIRELRAGRVVTSSGRTYQLGKPDPNAVSAAFAIRREFAYLVLLLCFISLQGPGMPPAAPPYPAEPSATAPVLAFAASSRNGRKPAIQ
jgi:hypothetical protein